MAITLTVNTEFKDQIMSHGDVCAKALGDHTQSELLNLAIQARNSGNPVLLRCFKDLPALTALVGVKVETEQAAVVPPVPATKKP